MVRSSDDFWKRRTGLEKAFLVILGVCGTVMVAGGTFWAVRHNDTTGNTRYLDPTLTCGPESPIPMCHNISKVTYRVVT